MPSLAFVTDVLLPLTLLAVAISIAAYALFWDRARNRKRCPRCWYDMIAVDGRRCPECGRQAKSGRALKRTRRRWRLTLLCLPLLIGGWILYRRPEIAARGWIAATPTSALILAQDLLERPKTQSKDDLSLLRLPDGPVLRELVFRVKQGQVWDWQTEWLIRRSSDFSLLSLFMRLEAERKYGLDTRTGILLRKRLATDWLEPGVTMRDRWPADIPVWVRIDPDGFVKFGGTDYQLRYVPEVAKPNECTAILEGGRVIRGSRWLPDLDPDTTIGTLAPGDSSVQFRVEVSAIDPYARDGIAYPLTELDLHVPIRQVRSIDAILTPVQGHAIDSALLHGLHGSISQRTDTGELKITLRASELLLQRLRVRFNTALGLTATLYHGDTELASASYWTEPHKYRTDPLNPNWVLVSLPVVEHEPTRYWGSIERSITRESEVCTHCSIKIRSNPVMALRHFEFDQYWAGEVELRLLHSGRCPMLDPAPPEIP